MNLGDRTLREYLQVLGQSRTAPTAGSVAGLCIAQASALVAMVARSASEVSGDGASAPRDTGPPMVAACEELVSESMDLMEQDARSVDALMHALSLPRESLGQRSVRSEAVRVALTGAIGPQTGIVGIASRLVAQMEPLASLVSAGIRVDLAAAAQVTAAAVSVARLNVEANTSFVSETNRAAAMEGVLAEADRCIRRCRALVERIAREE